MDPRWAIGTSLPAYYPVISKLATRPRGPSDTAEVTLLGGDAPPVAAAAAGVCRPFLRRRDIAAALRRAAATASPPLLARPP